MIKQRINSFKYAWAGILDLFKSQPNAQIHLFVTSFVLFFGWYFQISTTEWCLSIFAIAFVLSAEAANTALEYLTDLVSPDYNALAGKAKDAAAAAVLIAALGAAVIGLIVFLPKFLAL